MKGCRKNEGWKDMTGLVQKQTIRIASSIKTTLSNAALKLKPSGIKTKLSFTSGNKKIATVVSKGSYGFVKLHRPGKVKITIEAQETERYQYAAKTIVLNIGLAKPKYASSITLGKTYTVKVRAVDQAKKHYSGWSSKTVRT